VARRIEALHERHVLRLGGQRPGQVEQRARLGRLVRVEEGDERVGARGEQSPHHPGLGPQVGHPQEAHIVGAGDRGEGVVVGVVRSVGHQHHVDTCGHEVRTAGQGPLEHRGGLSADQDGHL